MRNLRNIIIYALIFMMMLSIACPVMAVDEETTEEETNEEVWLALEDLEVDYYEQNFETFEYSKIKNGTHKNVTLMTPYITEEAIYTVSWGKQQTIASAAKGGPKPGYAELSYKEGGKNKTITMFVGGVEKVASNEYLMRAFKLVAGWDYYCPLEIVVKGNKVTITDCWENEVYSGSSPKIKYATVKVYPLSEECVFINGKYLKEEITVEETVWIMESWIYRLPIQATLTAKNNKITSVYFPEYIIADGYIPAYDEVPGKELFDQWMAPLSYTLTAPNQSSYLPEQYVGVIVSKGGKGVNAYGSPTGNNKFSEYVKDGEEVAVMAIQSGRALIRVTSSGRAVWVGETAVSYDYFEE